MIKIGVSGGRNFCSSFTHMFTFAQDSRSVISYTIRAPKLLIKDVLLTFSSLVVDLVECMISLLASGVPNVDLDLAAPSHLNRLAQAARIDCTYLFVVEITLAETEGQGGLPHTRFNQLLRNSTYLHRARRF